MYIRTMREVWKNIVGLDGYQISNHGRIKRLAKIVRCKGGVRLLKEIIRKLSIDNGGYCYVTIKNKLYLIHRLVAIAFLPNPNNYGYVNHKDENKTNNFIYVNEDGTIDQNKSNLEWCSFNYNVNYGTRNKRLSLSKNKAIAQYDVDGKFIEIYPSIANAAVQSNIHRENISNCLNGRQKTAGGYVWKYAKK